MRTERWFFSVRVVICRDTAYLKPIQPPFAGRPGQLYHPLFASLRYESIIIACKLLRGFLIRIGCDKGRYSLCHSELEYNRFSQEMLQLIIRPA